MSFEAVHNYYEKLVQEHLNTLIEDPGNQLSEDEIDDMARLFRTNNHAASRHFSS